MKKASYSALAALIIGICALLISSSAPSNALAQRIPDGTEVQVLDAAGNELTNPASRPTTSSGAAWVFGLPQKSVYRVKLVSPNASCGATSNYRGFLWDASGDNGQTIANFTNLTGLVNGSSGWYAYTNLSDDINHTVDIKAGFYRE